VRVLVARRLRHVALHALDEALAVASGAIAKSGAASSGAVGRVHHLERVASCSGERVDRFSHEGSRGNFEVFAQEAVRQGWMQQALFEHGLEGALHSGDDRAALARIRAVEQDAHVRQRRCVPRSARLS
jgi:hypothetical protein